MTEGSRRHLVVVGAGITGLAAAWEASAHDDVDVTLLESSDRVGGRIRTSDMDLGDGHTLRIDEGADAFLARVPEAVELCAELGLTDRLTQPAVGRAKVFVEGRLRFLPGDAVLGVPLFPASLASTGLLTTFGAAAAAAETSSDAPAPDGDVAIGPFLTEHYGGELVDRVVGPLIGGINAGDVDRLSLDAVTPQLAVAAADGGSLSLALQRRQNANPPTGPIFHALLEGTGSLIDALHEALLARGVTIRHGATVTGFTAGADGTTRIELAGADSLDADSIEADAVALCTPAPAASDALRELSPEAAALLAGITHSSVSLVTFVYRLGDVPSELDASGFLVPRTEGLLMTAVSWGSSKWAHWNDGRHVVLRVSAGRAGDERQTELDDDALVAALRDDLHTTMGITEAPRTTRVSRYPAGFAQYEVGHLDRVAAIDAAIARDHPTVVVAGAAYRGVGIPACIRQGRSAVTRLLG